jgi:hypothetical protein
MVGIITLDDLLRELLADLTPDLGEGDLNPRSDSGSTPGVEPDRLGQAPVA